MESGMMKSVAISTLALALITFLLALLMMQPNAQGIDDVPSIWSEILFGISAVAFIAFLVSYFKASRGDEQH